MHWLDFTTHSHRVVSILGPILVSRCIYAVIFLHVPRSTSKCRSTWTNYAAGRTFYMAQRFLWSITLGRVHVLLRRAPWARSTFAENHYPTLARRLGNERINVPAPIVEHVLHGRAFAFYPPYPLACRRYPHIKPHICFDVCPTNITVTHPSSTASPPDSTVHSTKQGHLSTVNISTRTVPVFPAQRNTLVASVPDISHQLDSAVTISPLLSS